MGCVSHPVLQPARQNIRRRHQQFFSPVNAFIVQYMIVYYEGFGLI